MNLGGLERFLEAERGQDSGHALGQHGLAGTGWPDHQDVVAAGASDLEHALGGLLPANIFEIDGIVLGFAE
jgi:hypothetical protein